MSDKEVIHVPGVKALGPYSQAVRAGGLLFVSGQPGVNPSTGEAAGTSFEAQARRRHTCAGHRGCGADRARTTKDVGVGVFPIDPSLRTGCLPHPEASQSRVREVAVDLSYPLACLWPKDSYRSPGVIKRPVRCIVVQSYPKAAPQCAHI